MPIPKHLFCGHQGADSADRLGTADLRTSLDPDPSQVALVELGHIFCSHSFEIAPERPHLEFRKRVTVGDFDQAGMIHGILLLRSLKHHYRGKFLPSIRSVLGPALQGSRPYTSGSHYKEPSDSQKIARDASRLRNIGIIAHIDAGKTTTTERMLYYSGHTRRIGDVDDGSTVTDFLPAERARGITIQSAAISFEWPPVSNLKAEGNLPTQVEEILRPLSAIPHLINLIDTPGHADFTFEVRRSLRVLDGAICILDGVAGVEAQTEQVWKQAEEWQIPRIVYVNKLDRDGAAFGRTVKEVGARLGGWPVICQIPWLEDGQGRFTGIADVVTLQGMLYEIGGDGKTIRHFDLEQLQQREPRLAEELRRARIALVDVLSDFDIVLMEAFIEAEENHLAITPLHLLQSLRRTLLAPGSTIIPIFAGASFRNVGVQLLLDAVNNLLPSPHDRPDPVINIGASSGSLQKLLAGQMQLGPASAVVRKTDRSKSSNGVAVTSTLRGCALAFKVVNDARKGVLVYIRVYFGSIDKNALLFNTSLQVSERAATLLRMYASESVPVQSIEAGQIGVIAGSKFARTGDTLITYQGNKTSPPEPLDSLQLKPIDIPPPVFFASIEPDSLRDERDMHEKLALLLREDPSLQISQDEDTGQTLLSGMGELHLEIARDRLVNDLKARARMGKIAIGYRETLSEPSNPISMVFFKDRTDAKGRAGCTAHITPLQHASCELAWQLDETRIRKLDGNIIVFDAPSLNEWGRALDDGDASLPTHLTLHEVQAAYMNGALAALSRGPAYSYPVRNVKVLLTLEPLQHIFATETTYASLTAAARVATAAALRDAFSRGGSSLMEPVMIVDISVDESNMGTVIQDISSSRGGHIIALGDEAESRTSAEGVKDTIDVRKIYTPPDPFEFESGTGGRYQRPEIQRTVRAKVPLKEMVGYMKHLRSMTGGRGTFVMSIDRFEKMTGQRERALLAESYTTDAV